MPKRPFAVQKSGVNPLQKRDSGPRPTQAPRLEREKIVTPLERGLAVLSSFDADTMWQGNKQIAMKTGIPTATTSRLLKSLVSLGYLHFDPYARKYRLAASSLGLGYAAIKDCEVPVEGQDEIRAFAEATDTYVTLCTRDRLNLVVVDSHLGSQALLALDMTPGARLSIAGALAGAAMLAILPDPERSYLIEQLEIKSGPEWPAQWKRLSEKISQVHKLGFCISPGEWVPELSSISVPIRPENGSSWVLSCTGRSFAMPRLRLEREFGPQLVTVARKLEQTIKTYHLACVE